MADVYRGLKTTTWPRPPHTGAKHAILERYLSAYFPILIRGGYPEVAFIDGFAGPGVYSEGEPGSPIVALQAALKHKSTLGSKRVTFHFWEPDQSRYESLLNEIDKLGDLPETFRVLPSNKRFSEALEPLLAAAERRPSSFPPALVMLDPFGWADMPMALIKRLAAFKKNEFLITLMVSEVVKHGKPSVERSLDNFFGGGGWRGASKRQLLNLYLLRLAEAIPGSYIRSFEMADGNNEVNYFLIFVTRNLKGLLEMKKAMWSLDRSGNFRFSDATNPAQIVMFGQEPDFGQLASQLRTELAGKTIDITALEDYVAAQTAFLPTQLRKAVLSPLERDREIRVDRPKSGRAGQYPLGTAITFLA